MLQPELRAYIFPQLSDSIVVAIDAEEAIAVVCEDIGRGVPEDWREHRYSEYRLHTSDAYRTEQLAPTVEKLHDLEGELLIAEDRANPQQQLMLQAARQSVIDARKTMEPS